MTHRTVGMKHCQLMACLTLLCISLLVNRSMPPLMLATGIGAFLIRAGKAGLLFSTHRMWLPSVNRLINNYFVQSNTHPLTPFVNWYHLSVVHHASPMPVYITKSFHPKSPALPNAILSTMCCTKTDFCFSEFSFFFISPTVIVDCI